MDGYSVEEAAEVLGIPEGRVWELIARGVLAGASEGRADMRVFLKPPAGSGASTGVFADPEPRTNGGNGGPHVEASPFRELLTEFRNLTERYGQALLALGEARGEVAALRSRVEVLEARMDLRLPLRAASTVAWELPDRYASESEPRTAPAAEARGSALDAEPMPAPPAAGTIAPAVPEPSIIEPPGEAAPDDAPSPPPEVTVTVHAEAAAAPEATEAPSAPRRRVTGGRAAIAGLAEALARAEDPTLSDLPGAREAAEALAALQREIDTVAEERAAQPATEADEAEGQATEAVAEVPEPAGVEPQLAQVEPGEPDEPVEPETIAEEIQAAFAPAIEPFEETVPFEEPMLTEEPVTSREPDRAKEAAEEPVVAELPEPADEAAVAEEQVAEEPAPVEAPSLYTTEVVEPDWFADGDFTWLDVPDSAPTAAGPTPLRTESDEPHEPDEASDEPIVAEPEPTEHQAAVASPEAIPDEAAAPEAETPPEVLARGEAGPAPEHDTEPQAAIQEAFDEPAAADAADAAPSEAAWPEEDHRSITGSEAVGFNLFREPAHAPQPPSESTDAPASAEEELLWFGDEFEAAELEVAAPGWRDGERAPATPPAATVAPGGEPLVMPVADDGLERLAMDEGWNEAEIDAIRAYLGRGEPEPAESETPFAQPPTAAPTAPDDVEALPPDAPAPPASVSPVQPGQDWLRGRRGPAATAYRRLRRLIQG